VSCGMLPRLRASRNVNEGTARTGNARRSASSYVGVSNLAGGFDENWSGERMPQIVWARRRAEPAARLGRRRRRSALARLALASPRLR